jgi:hypothetical protein
MPKLFGLSLIGVIVASVVFFAIGAAWYGYIFADKWMAEMGITKEAAEAANNPMYMVFGFVFTVFQVVGIGLAMKWRNAMNLNGGVVTAILLWVCFALPFCAYGYLYSIQHSQTLFLIDASHLLLGWVASAVTLALVKA